MAARIFAVLAALFLVSAVAIATLTPQGLTLGQGLLMMDRGLPGLAARPHDRLDVGLDRTAVPDPAALADPGLPGADLRRHVRQLQSRQRVALAAAAELEALAAAAGRCAMTRWASLPQLVVGQRRRTARRARPTRRRPAPGSPTARRRRNPGSCSGTGSGRPRRGGCCRRWRPASSARPRARSPRATRAAPPASAVSPSSCAPPGRPSSRQQGGLARRTSRTASGLSSTTPMPTMGRTGYSRVLMSLLSHHSAAIYGWSSR